MEYLNTGRASSPKMWADQFGTSGSKLAVNNNKINKKAVL